MARLRAAAASGVARAARAGLAVGAAWALWHLPLFFIEGTYQAGLGIASADAALFFGALLIDAVVMTWLVLRTRSLWSAVAYHWTTNLAGEALDLPFEAALVRTALALLVAVVLVARGALRSNRAARKWLNLATAVHRGARRGHRGRSTTCLGGAVHRTSERCKARDTLLSLRSPRTLR